MFFKLTPLHVCTALLSLLLQSLTLHPAQAPSCVVVCSRPSSRFPYPLRQLHVTTLTHRGWNYSAIQSLSDQSYDAAFLIPQPSSTPRNYKMRFFIWSQTRILMNCVVVRRPSFIATFTPDFAGYTAQSHANCSSYWQHFQF